MKDDVKVSMCITIGSTIAYFVVDNFNIPYGIIVGTWLTAWAMRFYGGKS